MIRSCGLILEDPETNKEGITLAAILIFGTDNRIMSVLPQHKTDAIFRVFNVDRYDCELPKSLATRDKLCAIQIT